MVTHMKTTIDLPDALLADARRVASREKTTLRALMEEGLREALRRRKAKPEPFRLRDASFQGEGLQTDIAEGDWAAIRDRAYEGHGG